MRELRIRRPRYANKCLRYLGERIARDFWKFLVSRRKFLDGTKESFAGIIYLEKQTRSDSI